MRQTRDMPDPGDTQVPTPLLERLPHGPNADPDGIYTGFVEWANDRGLDL